MTVASTQHHPLHSHHHHALSAVAYAMTESPFTDVVPAVNPHSDSAPVTRVVSVVEPDNLEDDEPSEPAPAASSSASAAGALDLRQRVEALDEERELALTRAAALEAELKASEADVIRMRAEANAKADETRELARLLDDAVAALQEAVATHRVEEAELRKELERARGQLAAAAVREAELRDALEEACASALTSNVDRAAPHAGPSTGAPVEEEMRERMRAVTELLRAIEPFTWGLQRASAFFGERRVDGADEHVRVLQLLDKTLTRLKGYTEQLT